MHKNVFDLKKIFCSHGADVGVKAGEDDTSFAAFPQHAGQDDVEEGVHVEVGRKASLPWAILSITTYNTAIK